MPVGMAVILLLFKEILRDVAEGKLNVLDERIVVIWLHGNQTKTDFAMGKLKMPAGTVVILL